MERLINYILDNQEIEKLSNDEADQALYYIDFLLDEETDIKEIIKLMYIKIKLVKHISNFDSYTIPGISSLSF